VEAYDPRLKPVGDSEQRVGITPKSWTAEPGVGAHHGVLHLGKRWYVISAEIDEHGRADGVRLDGPFVDRDAAEARARSMQA
jgi:hypothetical protein